MHILYKIVSIFAIFFVFVVFGASPTEKPKQCAKVVCTTPPEGLKCNKTEIKNPNLLKKVGNLKDCCSAWRCQEEDGTFSTYYGISGTATVPGKAKDVKDSKGKAAAGKPKGRSIEKAKDKNAATTTTTSTTPTPQTTLSSGSAEPTPAPSPSTSTTPTPASQSVTTESPGDKCAEAKAKCPMPDGDDACSVTASKDAMQFKPKGDLDSCCPIYNCTRSDGAFRLHYLMKGGEQPKKPAAIKSSKGPPEDGRKCSKVQCAEQPSAPSSGDGPICEKSWENESERIKGLGPFKECCDMWKCAYPDGSFYTHFELQAPTFWLAETTFQSEPLSELPPTTSTPKPVVSGDEIEEAAPSSAKKKGRKLQQQPQKNFQATGSSYQAPDGSSGGSSYAYSSYYSNSNMNQGMDDVDQGLSSDDPSSQMQMSQMPQMQQQQMMMGPQGGVPMGPPPGTVPMGPPMMMQQQMMMPGYPAMPMAPMYG